jgi:hypothetical protein
MKLDPAKTELMAHLAILQLLFFSSVANTAPRCESSFFRQSTPPECCTGGGGGGGIRDSHIMITSWFFFQHPVTHKLLSVRLKIDANVEACVQT